MEILITVLIAILSYKIKLIDDRKNNNFERYKNYFKRTILVPDSKNKNKEYDATETGTWLNKDIPCHMIKRYKKTGDVAVLDYYQDYKDNKNDKRDIIILIFLNITYFFMLKSLHVDVNSNLNIILDIVLSSFVLYVTLIKESKVSIINNPLVNINNSSVAKNEGDKIAIIIEKEFIKYKKDYDLKD